MTEGRLLLAKRVSGQRNDLSCFHIKEENKTLYLFVAEKVFGGNFSGTSEVFVSGRRTLRVVITLG